MGRKLFWFFFPVSFFPYYPFFFPLTEGYYASMAACQAVPARSACLPGKLERAPREWSCLEALRLSCPGQVQSTREQPDKLPSSLHCSAGVQGNHPCSHTSQGAAQHGHGRRHTHLPRPGGGVGQQEMPRKKGGKRIDKMPKIGTGLSEPEQGWHPGREIC